MALALAEGVAIEKYCYSRVREDVSERRSPKAI